MNVIDCFEQAVNWLLHVGIQVYRINNLGIRVPLRCLRQRLANSLETTSKAFSSVPGHQDQFSVFLQERKLGGEASMQLFVCIQLMDHFKQSINDSIASNVNMSLGNPSRFRLSAEV